MKVEELPPELFVGGPRYLTQERFVELAGLQGQPHMLARWIAEGTLPTRHFGCYQLIDMQALHQCLNPARGTQG
ncbi:DNA-binding protein [Pseudomonas sp. CrR25]|nr:DNA-binding protein [Pseudomonas sp. CrR25]